MRTQDHDIHYGTPSNPNRCEISYVEKEMPSLEDRMDTIENDNELLIECLIQDCFCDLEAFAMIARVLLHHKDTGNDKDLLIAAKSMAYHIEKAIENKANFDLFGE